MPSVPKGSLYQEAQSLLSSTKNVSLSLESPPVTFLSQHQVAHSASRIRQTVPSSLALSALERSFDMNVELHHCLADTFYYSTAWSRIRKTNTMLGFSKHKSTHPSNLQKYLWKIFNKAASIILKSAPPSASEHNLARNFRKPSPIQEINKVNTDRPYIVNQNFIPSSFIPFRILKACIFTSLKIP